MSASDKFDTVDTLLSTDSAIHDSTQETKKKGNYWLRVYKSSKEGSAKLPYDTCLDQMPILKGSSDFAKKNNKFLKDLFILCRDHLEPGEEKTLNLVVKVYRKTETDTSLDDVEDDDEISFI